MDWITGAVYAGFLLGTGALAVIDLREHRLPNRITFPLYAWGALGLSAASAVGHDWERLASAAGGAAGLFALFWLFWFFGPTGYGDVKLAGVIGLFLGWAGVPYLVAGLLLGMLGAALLTTVLVLARRLTRRSAVAYGPYLVAGSWAGLLLALVH